jgi:uncharacterized protein (DUF924 family)
MTAAVCGIGRDGGGPGEGEPAWVDEVLRFWFEELSAAQWWRKDESLDARIRERFLDLHARILAHENLQPPTPREALTTVIVLDQFPRNMFRGDARAYAADPLARRIAKQAIAAGLDAAMTKNERLFLYMPLQHSEDAGDQQLGFELTAALGDDTSTRFALAHKRIIDRFGRFPHRNTVLGRISTPEEIASLREPMSSF